MRFCLDLVSSQFFRNLEAESKPSSIHILYCCGIIRNRSAYLTHVLLYECVVLTMASMIACVLNGPVVHSILRLLKLSGADINIV